MNRWQLGIGFKGDLRFFIHNATGLIAVADNSGADPDRTDDGVLWVDASRPLVIDAKCLRIPVLKDTDNRHWCAVSIGNAEATVAFLANHYEQLTVAAGDDANGDKFTPEAWHMVVLRDHLRRVRDAQPRPERNPLRALQVRVQAARLAELEAEEA